MPSWLLSTVLCATFLSSTSSTSAKGPLVDWERKSGRFNAQIDSADLPSVLREVARQTGWEIYLQPDTLRRVSAKFRNLPVGEALKQILGDLNFALLPQTNAPSRLLVYRTSINDATERVASPESSGRVIPNELIVTLKDGSGGIDALAKQLGAKVIGQIDGMNAYRLQFADSSAAEEARKTLAENSTVESIDLNHLISTPNETDRLQASSNSLPFNLKPKVSNDGSRTIVGVIDTAIQPLGNGMDAFLLPSLNMAGETSIPAGQISHGTSMAETILNSLSFASSGDTSTVRLLPVDVYGSSPDANTFNVARGIYSAIENGANIINLSMGGEGDNGFLAALIRNAREEGVLFFGAAGNSPTTSPTFPAAYPEVVAVTAGDRRGNIAPYANRGDFVDVIAPGMSVVEFNGQSYVVNGTSTSTAYVSGAAAALRATGQSAASVENYIRTSLSAKAPAKP